MTHFTHPRQLHHFRNKSPGTNFCPGEKIFYDLLPSAQDIKTKTSKAPAFSPISDLSPTNGSPGSFKIFNRLRSWTVFKNLPCSFRLLPSGTFRFLKSGQDDDHPAQNFQRQAGTFNSPARPQHNYNAVASTRTPTPMVLLKEIFFK